MGMVNHSWDVPQLPARQEWAIPLPIKWDLEMSHICPCGMDGYSQIYMGYPTVALETGIGNPIVNKV
jgi:hypothetical protein